MDIHWKWQPSWKLAAILETGCQFKIWGASIFSKNRAHEESLCQISPLYFHLYNILWKWQPSWRIATILNCPVCKFFFFSFSKQWPSESIHAKFHTCNTIWLILLKYAITRSFMFTSLFVVKFISVTCCFNKLTPKMRNCFICCCVWLEHTVTAEHWRKHKPQEVIFTCVCVFFGLFLSLFTPRARGFHTPLFQTGC